MSRVAKQFICGLDNIKGWGRLKSSITLVGIVLLLGFIWVKPAHAASIHPDPAGTIPAPNYSYLTNYLTPPGNPPGTGYGCPPAAAQSPAVTRWISLATSGAQTSVTVNYGTPFIDLRYHIGGVVCINSRPIATAEAILNATASPAGTVTRPVPSNVVTVFAWNDPGHYSQGNTNVFRYSPAGGFTKSGQYWITLTTVVVNQWNSPPNYFTCVANGAVTDIFGSGCPQSVTSFPILVTVRNAPNRYRPEGDLTSGSCVAGRVAGWAFDKDNLAAALNVRVYVNGPMGSGVLIGSPVASAPRGVPIGNHGYSVNIPAAYLDNKSHTYYAYAENIDANGNGTGEWVQRGQRVVPPCPGPTCTLTINPGNPEINTSFTVTAQINYAGPTPIIKNPVDSMRITVIGPAGATIYNQVVGFNPIPNAGDPNAGKATTGAIISNVTGQLNMTGLLSGQFNVSCTNTTNRVVTKPYVRFYGDDVFAGTSDGLIGSSCVGWSDVGTGGVPPGTIQAYSGPVGSGLGSGAQFGVLALSQITNFSSAILHAGPPGPNRGLTFSNLPAVPKDGGMLTDLYVHCPDDFYSQHTVGTVVNRSNATLDLGSADITSLGGKGTYKLFYTPIGGKLYLQGTLPVGYKISLYVDGDVVVTNPTLFAPGPWASTPDIPSLLVSSYGNIFITSTVTTITGSYVAQPRLRDATPTYVSRIVTCIDRAGNEFTAVTMSAYIAACSNQLLIKGQLAATWVKLLRLGGTLGDSKPGEQPRGAVNGPCGKKVCAAEVFDPTPDAYMGGPLPTNTSKVFPYDFIETLPPVL